MENTFITKDNAIHFNSGDVDSLRMKLQFALDNYDELLYKAKHGLADISKRFSWEQVTDQYINLLQDI